MSVNYPLVDISTQPIELCKLLKIANMVSGGGEAKIVISEGYVLLNNEVEFQKRKKVYHNDIIEFNGDVVQVNHVKSTTKKIEKNKINTTNNSAQKLSKNNDKRIDITLDIEAAPQTMQRKRKPISF